ncbi:hypothetical protein BJ912DRAFT_985087 [Pholiota molesta]|nr:hypothetical protein BJ912DRAFT_985087 [Pholiota molesta]
MLEYYDSSPYVLETQQRRLRPALSLSDANIRCLVWAEDALAFIHFVPTSLFTLQLIVADQNLEAASTAIMHSLPYKVFTGIDKNFVESILYDPSQPSAFPHSVCLELTTPGSMDDPEKIFIHPMSQFYCDVHDNSRTLSHPPFSDNIRFPTRIAFLDSMIAMNLDPPSGRSHSKVTSMLLNWIAYLFTYTLRKRPAVLSNGDLEPERKEVLQSLREENRPYFNAYARRAVNWEELALGRKKILEKLGRHEEARRPLPPPFPGNPALLAKRKANLLANQKRPYSLLASNGTRSVITNLSRFVR